MTTITYNPETHVLVPKGMMYELPELPMPIKGKFSKDLFDGVQMHQYAMRYLDEAIAAAPQPLPNPNWCAGCSPDNCSSCGAEPVESEPVCEWVKADGANYIHPKWHKDYVAVEGDKLYTTPQPDRTAELEKQLATQKEYYESVFADGNKQIAKHKAQSAELEAALKVAKAALEYYVPMIKQGDSPAEEVIAKIEGVLKHA